MSALAGVTVNVFQGLSSGFTLRWIIEVLDLYTGSILLSLWIALVCLAVTLVVGVPLAYVLVRRPGRWTRLFEELLTLPVAIPGLALALALVK